MSKLHASRPIRVSIQVKTTGPRMNNRQLNITLNEFTFKAPKVKFAESYKDTEMYNPQTCLSSGNNLPFYLAYTILPKVLGHPLILKGLTTLEISMSSHLNV